nr:ubiquitin-like 1-activating enzyme E1 B [Cryptococcus depauperatus CBS 7855]
MPRSTYTQALLGAELYEKVRSARVLVVGAGGIGSELLKNLVMVGFADIEIIDLDTIDLSNLNRQFLFRKPDISKPKALVAASTAHRFNPNSGIKINARHGNVKESVNDLEWIKGFELVMSALDNMDARRHVNKLCQAAGVPLVESGTAGYLGQVSPMIKDQTECFDCVPKPAPKAFPVCTIRSTPSEPIHCIVWGKNYLFNKLFGEDDEDMEIDELNRAKANGNNAEEIENLKQETQAFREVKNSLAKKHGPQEVFQKVFSDDVNRLLGMEDMWNKEGRVKPVPLNYKEIMYGTFVVPPLRNARSNGRLENSNKSIGKAATEHKNQLRDQKELSLKENLEIFISSCQRLSARVVASPNIPLSFDKDDDDTLDFVLATANLRATSYGIPTKTRFQVKEMAGNIIPAIATTNAIIAGLIVMQSLNILSHGQSSTSSHTIPVRNVFLRIEPARPLGSYVPSPPDPTCSVCRDVYVPFKVDTSKTTLGDFVNDVVKIWLEKAEFEGGAKMVEWTVFEGGRLLADPDFEDNFERTLEDLNVGSGKFLTVRDEDAKFRPVHFCICKPQTCSHSNATLPYILPSEKPKIPLAPAKLEQISSEESDVTDSILVKTTSKGIPNTVAGIKRSSSEHEDGKSEELKRRRLNVVDEDDDFEIL